MPGALALRPRQEWLIGAALFAATVVTRILFRSQVLIGGDSINYARSLERYSIADDSPHSPGYILFVAAARLVNLFLNDPNSSLVALSILCAALSTAAIYFVGRRLFNDATGIAAAVLLLFSPLFWYESEVALSHIVELPWALLTVWLLYQLYFERRNAVFLAVVIGVSGGFRQDVLMFMAPLWLIGTFRVGKREMLLSWAAMFISVLAWLTPVIYLSGGLWGFLDAGGSHFSESTSQTSVFSAGAGGLLKNLKEIWLAMLWLLGAALILLVPLAAAVLLRSRQRPDKRTVFLAALTVPALLFFTLVNFSHPGYILIIAGPVLLLIAWALTWSSAYLVRVVMQEKEEIAATLNAVLLIVFLLPVSGINAYLFIKAPDISWPVPPGGNTVSSLYGNFSAGGIRNDARQTDSAVSLVKEYSAGDTLVACFPTPSLKTQYFIDCRRFAYSLPDYRMVTLDSGILADYLNGGEKTPNTASLISGITTSARMQGEFKRIIALGPGSDAAGNINTRVFE